MDLSPENKGIVRRPGGHVPPQIRAKRRHVRFLSHRRPGGTERPTSAARPPRVGTPSTNAASPRLIPVPPIPSSTTQRGVTTNARRGVNVPRRYLPLLIAALGLTLVTVGVARTTHSHHHLAQSGELGNASLDPTRVSQGIAASGPATASGPTVLTQAPILLPPPAGNALRTRPLDTVWILDPGLARQGTTRSAFASEAPIAVAYLARYSLPNDEFALAGSTPLNPIRTIVADSAALFARPISTQAGPAQAIAAAERQVDAFPRYDHAIVVLTDNPARWIGLLPVGPAPSSQRDRAAITRSYLIAIRPGSGALPETPAAPGPSPESLSVDPETRGRLAEALARVFVDSINARWTGPSVKNS
jgi:hypothetical protein